MAKRLKTGEKVLFGIAVFFIAGAAVLWVVLESKDTPMEATTFWTFDEAGLRGQKVFQREGHNFKNRCIFPFTFIQALASEDAFD